MTNYSLKSLLSLVVIVFCGIQSCAQNNVYQKQNYFTIVSYNVENLFDTIDDPNKMDNEFLPDSANQWNSERYQKKIKDLSQVIASINKNELPELVGLIEVENLEVLKDLIKSKFLIEGGYSIIHHDSPDERGIDVALLYRNDEFKYISYEIIPINFDFEPETKTRDILYVKGKISDNGILHVFVNHWSSRRDGQDASEAKRLYSAKLLRAKVDSIQSKDKKARIVILGDFNDEPSNKSLCEVLLATNNQNSPKANELYNLMFDKHLMGLGTYNYRGNWNMLDNIIVSQSLLNSPEKYEISKDGGQIFQARWMIYDNVKTGDFTPNRTYSGPKYLGGISDHFPVYLILKK
jgi:predicted extracellular nuclease